ncbi:hypothetical protein F2Q70_00040292 [Brassica cretica]|uniref:Uncharacterized protein n=2 Tax=Brassica cretica TaxID=69181 RepID=A0A8S9KAJ0_BRACR|nr:hypothetical protein F2Q70_00040292 [Brassica cretica]KAF2620412.1 hypothetical protein F2Q68_00040987 [Brassica cretica]KAF3493547.1 hypothetical protein DY000_02055265 [Brassica cretica]
MRPRSVEIGLPITLLQKIDTDPTQLCIDRLKESSRQLPLDHQSHTYAWLQNIVRADARRQGAMIVTS